jgi:hypothetical protein
MGEIAGFKPWQQNQKDNMEKRYDEAAAWANDDEPDIWTKGDIKRICHT